jgi:DNA invertase Pin-like site-specific DNA recombinase
MEIKKLIEQKGKFTLLVLSMDRLGRNSKDIINTIYFFTENAHMRPKLIREARQ